MTDIRTRHDGLSPQEAADELGVHFNTIYKWMTSGQLPFTQIGPHPKSPRRIKPEDLEPFRHGGSRSAAAAASQHPDADEADAIADGIEFALGEDPTAQDWIARLRALAVALRR